jgi:hypothetical protein
LQLRDDPYSLRRMEREFEETRNNPNRAIKIAEARIINKRPFGYDEQMLELEAQDNEA